MIRYENDCCDCAVPGYPCLGNSCELRHFPHYYCDSCGDETELYDFEGKELCANCVLSKFEVVTA